MTDTFFRVVTFDPLIVEAPEGQTGPTGPPGPDGPQGPPGADGADGVDGADGADGADGSDGATGPAGASSFYEVEMAGTPGGVDDSTLFQTAVTAAIAAGKTLRLRPGVTYRAMGVDLTGCTMDARGATVKVPSSVVADHMFKASGAWTLIGGVFDGNKASTTTPASYTAGGNGIYMSVSSSGWTGTVQLQQAPEFKNFWFDGVVAESNIGSLTDGASAPYARIFVSGAIVHDNGSIGMRFTGLRGVTLLDVEVYDHAGSHGMRTFLCRDLVVVDANSHDNSGGHGMSSLYCYDQYVIGKFNSNGTDGLVFGGDSTSPTNQPGRYIRVPSVECNGNGNIGLCFDATITSLHAPVPVYAQVGIVHADGNTNEGVIVNSSQWVWFDSVFTDNNGGHGISFASRNCGFGFHHAHGNGQKPLALQGNSTDPNWGQHWIGQRDYASNTPDDTNTIGTVLADSTWVQTNVSNDTPPQPAAIYAARKTSGTSRISSTVLTADPDLTIANLPIGEYTIEGFLVYDSSTTADFATSWNLPSGASINQGYGGEAGTTTTNNPAVINEAEFATAAGPVLGGVGVGTATFARMTGYLKVTTAGAITFKWAQNTTDATNTTLQAGSWIKFTKIA